MSILHHTPTAVEPDYHTFEPTPLEALVAPAESDCPCERGEQARYVIEPRYSAKMGMMLYWSVDRAEDRRIRWFVSRDQAAKAVEDLNAEDHEPLVIGGRPWYAVDYPVPAWDGPCVRLASPSQARPGRTIDGGYPAF